MLLTDSKTALKNLSALVDFSNLINSTLEIEFTLNNLLLTIFGKFHTTKGIVALINSQGIYEIKASKGVSNSILVMFPNESINEIDTSIKLKCFLEENNFPICKKIYSSNKVIGLLILGERFIKEPFTKEDEEFINTLLNISATAIENSLSVEQLKRVNRDLDGKVNQLSSLFDLGKEFSGILETKMVGKLLVFSIIGQMMVSKYAVAIIDNNEWSILESKYTEDKILDDLNQLDKNTLSNTLKKNEIPSMCKNFTELGVELLIPMKIKGEPKGVIILGKRINNQKFTNSDIEYVSSVGSLAIISIENSRLFAEAVEKNKMEKDLELATTIQKNLLPKTFPSLNYFQIAAASESARQVGGDYYDVLCLENNRALVAIGDVSGKGVQAALMMANLQAFLKSIWKQNLELADATNLINDLVSDNTIMGNFITFFWALLNDENKSFTFVNAGHNPPLLIRNGGITKLKKGGMILGVMETTIPYESTNIILESGDAVILFTDGITEAMNNNGEEYSDERFEKLVLEHAHKDAQSLLDTIRCDVMEFTQGAEQSDDITILVIKVV
jgi:sigma-B regulation protein RsbU (phosphoserine phosphatase)